MANSLGDLILSNVPIEELRAGLAADIISALRPVLTESREPLLVCGDRMAELGGVSRPTLDREVRDGKIPSVLIGRRRLFDPADVIAAWKERTTANEKGPAATDPESLPTSNGGSIHDSHSEA